MNEEGIRMNEIIIYENEFKPLSSFIKLHKGTLYIKVGKNRLEINGFSDNMVSGICKCVKGTFEESGI